MYKPRYRKFMITIWPNASCWDTFKDTLIDTKCRYAYIEHQPEEDEADKGSHYHIVIEFDSARTFGQCEKLFCGAHIENIKYLVKSYRYLIHLDHPEKVQYRIEDIESNICFTELCEIIGECYDKIPFSIEDLKLSLENGLVCNLWDCAERYSLSDFNKYRSTIKDLLSEFATIKYDSISYIQELKKKYESLKLQLQDTMKELGNS